MPYEYASMGLVVIEFSTIQDKVLEGETFGNLTPDIIWQIIFWQMLTFTGI